MATTVLGLKTFAASDPVDYNEVNDNYVKIDNGVKTAMQGRAAHNLLDNSWFVNPVNQRGKTSYTSGNEYTIDRWRTTYNTSLSIQNGYINVYGKWNVRQILINPKNGVYTFAAKIRINSKGDNKPYMSLANTVKYLDAPIGQWKTYVSTCDLSAVGDDTVAFIIDISGNTTDGSMDVEWAALYEGSYTAETLPAYVPKGYAAELAECQRYYQIIPFDFSMYNVAVDSSYPSRYQITLPQEMRIAPTVSFAESWNSNVKSYTSSYVSKKALAFTVSANSNGYTEWHGSIALSADL